MTAPGRVYKWGDDGYKPRPLPRTKMALTLWMSGAVRTQREAAEIAGVSPCTVSIARHRESGKELEQQFNTGVMEKAMSLSAVIAKLSEKALRVMDEQITNGSSEEVKFKAAKDILDRNPETSKTNKVQVESFTLSGRDAKEIAAALAEGRALHAVDAEVAAGDYVKVQEVSERPSLTEVSDGMASGESVHAGATDVAGSDRVPAREVPETDQRMD